MRAVRLLVILAVAITVTYAPVGAVSGTARLPVFDHPTLELQRTILTNPFAGSVAGQRPGDVEGVAYDPVRNSLWLADDSKFRLFEVDLATGELVSTVTQRSLALATQYTASGPPGQQAGLERPADLEGLAYDAALDVLYAFAGPCCPAVPHLPTVFRLTRSPASGRFVPETFQPLTAPLDDFSGVGAVNGELWAGSITNQLYRYDYPTNTFAPPTAPLPLSGHITGIGFSSDGSELWVTASDDQLRRFVWPTMAEVPDHRFALAELGLRDSRAVEVVGDQLVLGDGYDFYPAGTVEEFALRFFSLGRSAPQASFVANPAAAAGVIRGGAPLTVSFTDSSRHRPVGWEWSFGDGLRSAARHPIHTFDEPGRYAVRLVATSPNGSSSADVIVETTDQPTAAFATSPTLATGPAPLMVAFRDLSKVYNGVITRWTWDFGDGTGSTERDPTHRYAAPGQYAVRLEVEGSTGTGRATATAIVSVSGRPIAAMTASATSVLIGEEVIFADVSTGYPAPTSRRWDLADGTSSAAASLRHRFELPGDYDVRLESTNSVGTTVATTRITVRAPARAPGYTGINPVRVLDTRGGPTFDGMGSTPGPLAGGSMLDVVVAGRVGVPSDGVDSVVLNVTATGATASTYVTVWPAGANRPTASNLNVAAGATVANLVIVPVGASGAVSMFSEAGELHLIVDVLGHVPAAQTAVFRGLTPARLADSRPAPTVDGVTQGFGRLGPESVFEVPVAGRGGVPATGVGSVALNVTAIAASRDTYLSVWPTGQPRPNSSNLNPAANATVANMVVVPLGNDGRLSLFNAHGEVDVAVDVLGWFPADSGLTGVGPARLVDTRVGGRTIDGRVEGVGRLGPGEELAVPVAGRIGSASARSAVLNVTAVDASAESYITVYPSGTTRPTASNLNFGAGRTVPNLVVVALGDDGSATLYNDSGTTDVIVDVLAVISHVP